VMVKELVDLHGLGYPMEWRDYVELHSLSSMMPEELVSAIQLDCKPLHYGKFFLSFINILCYY
jgi:hypothetical protein